MTEISAFLGVRPRAGPPRNSLQTRVESSGLPKTRCRLRIDLEPASIWGMSANMAVVIGPGPSGFHQSPRLGCENERWPATPPLRERGRVWAKDAGLSKG